MTLDRVSSLSSGSYFCKPITGLVRVRQPHQGGQQEQRPLAGSRLGVFKDQREAGMTSGARRPVLPASAS